MLSTIIGHDSLKGKLSQHFSGESSGTYLFYGPPSIGKRTTAFEISRAMLCEDRSGEDSCPSCKKFNGGHPDFLCLGQFERIKVADIDRVLDFSETTPLLSGHKAIVIDNAHEITWEAANRLLKLLEEPPKNFVFFLISSEPQFIIPTIRSRCISYQFNSLSREDVTNIIWKKLGFDLPQAKVLGWISNDSVDVFSRPGQYLKYRDTAFDFLSGIKYRRLVDSMDYIDKVEKNDMSIFIDMVMVLLTDFLLMKNVISSIINMDKLEDISKSVKGLNDRALVGIAGVFSQIKKYAYLNVNLNMNFKNALIKSYPLFQVTP
jgi:DNA polymerase-3 subunit delta'